MIDNNFGGYSLSTRTLSGYPLSIATGMACESLVLPTQPVYDPSRPLPPPTDLSKYDEFWVNISTLYRNMVGAMKKEGFLDSSPEDFKDSLLSEMDVINGLINDATTGNCVVRYYHTDHKKLKKSVPEQIKFREDKTVNQKDYTHRLDEALKLLHKETDQILSFDHEIKPRQKTKSLILSHIPYDLLSYTNFDKLSLLESHTGKRKERVDWNTKYLPVGMQGDTSMLPFNRKLLLIFGDKVLIQPSIFKLRQQILEAGKKRNWHGMTSLERMMMDLSLEIKEPFVLAFIKSL